MLELVENTILVPNTEKLRSTAVSVQMQLIRLGFKVETQMSPRKSSFIIKASKTVVRDYEKENDS